MAKHDLALRFMHWADEPATETQFGHLGQLGFKPGCPLTKGEAARLIGWFERHRAQPASPGRESVRERAEPEAYLLRIAVVSVRRAVALPARDMTRETQPELAQAIARRQEFWLNTCREVTQMRLASSQVLELYKQHGCRFFAPKPTEVQEILDALDSALPSWDMDYPALFYQTLELNFPYLVRLR